jgi:ribose transport system substrate-binding protein
VRQAQLLQEQLGSGIRVDYTPPTTANVNQQNSMLAQVAATNPAGIAIDPVDAIVNLPAIIATRNQGSPVVVFDSPSSDPAFCTVGNDFGKQGAMAAQRLVQLIGATGEVAIMQGFPTAPNHRQRYEAQLDVLGNHPGIVIVDGGIDNDDVSSARQQASVVLLSHPNLNGYLCCDASGPIGIATAIREAGKVGKVKAVGMDGIQPILKQIKDGVLDSSVATIPDMQGSMAVLMLWEASQGMGIPQRIDTGMNFITSDNVDRFLAEYAATRS